MQTSLNQRLKIPAIQGHVQSLRHSHLDASVSKYCCSDFAPSLGLLVEGEYNKPDSEARNARAVLTDLKTGQLRGGTTF